MNDRLVLYTLVSGLVGRELYNYWKSRTTNKQQKQIINEVLFFPDRDFPCKEVTGGLTSAVKTTCYNPACRKPHDRKGEKPSSMIRLLKYLSSAKKSVDLCMYVFTQPDMAKVLCTLHKSGVKIRIITDSTEDEARDSQLVRLSEAGIGIKSNKPKTGALMHHKFVVIDGRLLLLGSFNWTNNAVVSNYESVLVTSDKKVVSDFLAKFLDMWSEFQPHPKKAKKRFQ